MADITIEHYTLIEGAAPLYETYIKKEDASAVPDSALTKGVLTLYDVFSGAIVNGRHNQNIINANNVSIDNVGKVVWKMVKADTTLTGSPNPEVGHHRARLYFEWLDPDAAVRNAKLELNFYITREHYGA